MPFNAMMFCLLPVVSILLTRCVVAENTDTFEQRLVEKVMSRLPLYLIDHLEAEVSKLRQQVISQEKRIIHLEASHAIKSELIDVLKSDVADLRRNSIKSCSACRNRIRTDGNLKKEDYIKVNQTATRNESSTFSERLANSQRISGTKRISNSKHMANSNRDAHSEHIVNASRSRVMTHSGTLNSRHVAPVTRVRRGADGPVAFSAYLGQYVEHLAPGYIVKCTNVILNQGNAYDATSGVFTAPSDGVYLFDYHFDSSRHTVLALFIDGVNQLDAVTYPSSQQEGMGGNLILVQLKAGQGVWLEGRIISDGVVIGDDSFRYTTFSGVLLF